MESAGMAEKISSSTAFGFSGGNVLFGIMTANDLALIVGAICGVATVIINAYYKHKHYELARDGMRLGLAAKED